MTWALIAIALVLLADHVGEMPSSTGSQILYAFAAIGGGACIMAAIIEAVTGGA